jgi:hypothetical protein
MSTTTQQQQFLHTFYERANQKAPDNIVDFHDVGQTCGLDESESLELVGILTEHGFLEPKGPNSTYRLTPKGRQEVRRVLSGFPEPNSEAPRVIVNFVSFGNYQRSQEAVKPFHVGPQDCEAIASVLENMRQHITAHDQWAGYARDHLLAIVDDIETETEQSNPNSLRLQGLLMALAMAAHLAGDNTELDHEIRVALSFLRIDVF